MEIQLFNGHGFTVDDPAPWWPPQTVIEFSALCALRDWHRGQHGMGEHARPSSARPLTPYTETAKNADAVIERAVHGFWNRDHDRRQAAARAEFRAAKARGEKVTADADSWAKPFRILIDGDEAPTWTLRANEAEGWIEAIVCDDSGKPIVHYDRDEDAMPYDVERRFGHVEIFLRDEDAAS